MTKGIMNYFRWFVFLSVAFAVSVANADIESGLIGHWTFDEGQGTTAADSSGNGNDGTLNGGAQWVDGIILGAIEFNGSDAYVGTGQTLLNSMTEFTLACWVSPGNPLDARIGIVGQNDAVEFGFDGTNLMIWCASGGSATVGWTLGTYTWHHVAVVANGTNYTLYIDGQPAGSGGSAVTNYGTSTYPVNIGGGGVWDDAGNWFLGQIDDVRIYNRALSTDDMQELYEWIGGADAGDDQRVEAGQTVTLSGSGPLDATSFAWTQILVGDEPTVTLADPTSAETTFVGPTRTVGYILTFRLTVVSPTAGTTSDECVVVATAPNAPVLVPHNFRTYPGNLAFRLEWDMLVDADEYGVGFKLGENVYFWFWTGTPDTYYNLMNLTEGQATEVAVKARNGYGEGPRSEDIPLVPMRNYALPTAQGGTRPPSASFNFDGDPVAGMNDRVYDVSSDSSATAADTEDFWGYLWANPLYFDHVTYHTGAMSWNGGWFTDLRVQYTQDGTTWIDVPSRIFPEYNFANQRAGRGTYERFDLSIPTVRGVGIRIFGTPGGAATFTSIAELETFGDQATVRPLVVQGLDAEVPEYGIATLDGSLSFSTRGPLSGFAWVQTGGPTVEITGADQDVATFTAPGVDDATVLTFEFTAGDGTDTDTDEVTITVKNLVTTAVAGPDQRVYEGTPVTLDGTGSTTTSGGITYSWSQTDGTDVTLTGADTATPSFTAPGIWDYNEDLVFELRVEDGIGGASTDTVTVNVKNLMEGDISGDPWSLKAEDISDAAVAPGETTYDGATDTYTVSADGSDIWNASDSFRFSYLEASGDFSVSVCVGENPFQGGTNANAKAGPMVRDSLTAGSKYVFYFTERNRSDARLEARPTDYSTTGLYSSEDAVTGTLGYPHWLRLVRTGSTFTASYSLDGVDWTSGSTFVNDAFADPVYIGFAVTSHEAGLLTTVRFTDFRVNDQGPPLPAILPDAYAVRTLPGGYVPGGTADASLSVRTNPGDPPGTVTVTETIPAGLSAVPGSITHGGSVVGNAIRWTLTEGGVTDVGYSLQVPAGTSGALTFAGTVSFPGTTVDIYGDDTIYEIPSAPQNLDVEMLLAGYVSWSASTQPGVIGYRVYSSVNGQAWQEIAYVSRTSYVDESVVPGSTYKYKVSAVNAGGVEGAASPATDEKMITMQVREAEDFNYGGGLYPGYQDCPAAVEATAEDDLAAGNDFWHPNKGGDATTRVYRPNDNIGIHFGPTVDTTIGWVSPGSWWRYTFEVPEAGWIKLVFRIATHPDRQQANLAAYWDETLIGILTFANNFIMSYEVLEEQIETTAGVHTLRLQAADTGTSDCFDFDKIGIGFNWGPPRRQVIFEDDFEDYTTLYVPDDPVAAGWIVENGSGDPDARWRLWNTDSDTTQWLGNEDPNIAGMTNNYMITDADLAPNAAMDEGLLTPELDCTSFTKLRLDFSKNFRVYPEDTDHLQVGEVDIRTYDEETSSWSDWITLLRWDTTTVADINSDSEQVNLSAYDGKKLQIRWHFSQAQYDYWFAVDDVKLSGETKEIPSGQVLSLGLVEGKVELIWEVFGGGNYTVEYTDDLASGNWQAVPGVAWPITETAWPGEPIGALPTRCYRVRSE
jgi:hypothetical protein